MGIITFFQKNTEKLSMFAPKLLTAVLRKGSYRETFMLKILILAVEPETAAVSLSPKPPDSVDKNSNFTLQINMKHIFIKLNRNKIKPKLSWFDFPLFTK